MRRAEREFMNTPPPPFIALGTPLDSQQVECLTFNRKPRRSDITPEIKDNTTTLVILYNKGLVAKPDILYGLSKSYRKKHKHSFNLGRWRNNGPFPFYVKFEKNSK